MNGFHLILEKELKKFENKEVRVEVKPWKAASDSFQHISICFSKKEGIELKFLIRIIEGVFEFDVFGERTGMDKFKDNIDLREYEEDICEYHKIIKSSIENIIKNDSILRLQYVFVNKSYMKDSLLLRQLSRKG